MHIRSVWAISLWLLSLVSFVLSAPSCTITRTSTTLTQVTSPIPPATATRLVFLIYHVTPFDNGTTKTSTEIVTALPSTIRKREITTINYATLSKTPNYLNSSTISPNQTETSCQTITSFTTITVVIPITIPGETVTEISATTLFDYDYVSAPTFKPTELPGKTTSAMGFLTDAPLQPAPTQSPNNPASPSTVAAGNPPASRTDQPANTPGNPPGRPNNQPPEETQLPPLTLPGIGPVLVDPTETAIIVSSLTNKIMPGEQTTINGVPVSFDPSGSVVVVDGQTIPLPTVAPSLGSFPVVVNGVTSPLSQLVAHLTPGQVTTINGVAVSLGLQSSVLVVGSETYYLIPTSPQSLLGIGGTTIALSQLIKSLTPGQVTTINGVVVSLGAQSSILVIGSQTYFLSPGLSSPQSVLVVGGTTIAMAAISDLASSLSILPSGVGILLPNGQTLTPGGSTTINGVPISLSPSESQIVIAGSTIPVSVNSGATTTAGLGSYIYSGIGGFDGPTSAPAEYTGGADSKRDLEGIRHGIWNMFVAILMWFV